uniref:KIB1-4 beta-propeller domain-containing protein n=1 Tax=Oryza punctata TaxID=4537 RepID=A0A0E0JPH2_ORYPU
MSSPRLPWSAQDGELPPQLPVFHVLPHHGSCLGVTTLTKCMCKTVFRRAALLHVLELLTDGFTITTPVSCFVILANNHPSLVLYNLVTLARITLPPVTDFACVDAVYSSKRNLEYYACQPMEYTMQRIVLGDGSTKRRFCLAVHPKDGSTREVVVAASARPPGCVLTRHLVSTPWGDLLQVPAGPKTWYPDGIEFKICKVDPDARKMVLQENGLMDHALFLGLNHPACLRTQNLRGIRPRFIYFSAPVITHALDWLYQLRVWGGVRTYDLERGKFERSIPFCDVKKLFYGIFPSEVWITHDL